MVVVIVSQYGQVQYWTNNTVEEASVGLEVGEYAVERAVVPSPNVDYYDFPSHLWLNIPSSPGPLYTWDWLSHTWTLQATTLSAAKLTKLAEIDSQLSMRKAGAFDCAGHTWALSPQAKRDIDEWCAAIDSGYGLPDGTTLDDAASIPVVVSVGMLQALSAAYKFRDADLFSASYSYRQAISNAMDVATVGAFSVATQAWTTGQNSINGAGRPISVLRLDDFEFNGTNGWIEPNTNFRSHRKDYPTTNPCGNNLGRGRMEVTCDVFSDNYFTNNNAHSAIVLRMDPAWISQRVYGHGMIFGAVCDQDACCAIETWANQTMPADRVQVITETASPASRQMKERTLYRIITTSTIADDGNRYIRYKCWEFNSASPGNYWTLFYDTGDYLDHNSWFDPTKDGFAIASVFADASNTAWSLKYSNISVRWSSESSVSTVANNSTSTMAGMSSTGSEVMVTAPKLTLGKKTYIPQKASAALDDMFWAVRPAEANTDAYICAAPSGTAGNSGFIAFSDELPSASAWVSFGLVRTGAASSLVLNTGSLAAGRNMPDLKFKQGETLLMALDTTGATFSVPSVALPRSLTIPGRTGADNVGKFSCIRSALANDETYLGTSPNGTATASGLLAFANSNINNGKWASYGCSEALGAVVNASGGDVLLQRSGATSLACTSTGVKVNGSATALGGANWVNWTNVQQPGSMACPDSIPADAAILAAWVVNLVKIVGWMGNQLSVRKVL